MVSLLSVYIADARAPVLVSFASFQLIIPDSVSDEKALYLSDVLPTAYHSIVSTEG